MRHDRRLQQTEIKLNLDPQLPAINLAGNQIIQILMNLLANAADALTDLDNRSPQINVSSRTQGSAVIMEVEDNGCGMDQNTIAHASEAFFTTKSMGEGTGLGLSLCHSLIENHRGQMIIDSTPDQGTRITISLPIESDKDGAAV